MLVLGNDSFHYVNQWYGPASAVLEFQSTCEGIVINGVDMITWNADGQIEHFKVMVRPLKAVNKLHELMGRLLLAGRIRTCVAPARQLPGTQRRTGPATPMPSRRSCPA